MIYTSCERLSEHLLYVSEDILDLAYSIDCAEKLKAYKKAQKTTTARTCTLPFSLRKIATVAACFMLLAGILLSPLTRGTSNTVRLTEGVHNGWLIGTGGAGGEQPSDDAKLPWAEEIRSLDIQSLDMLNYYTAIKVLSDAEITASRAEATGYTRLSSSHKAKTLSSSTEVGIYFDPLDPKVFTVTRVIFFQIRLEDEDSFLASRVGVGIINVVITENNLSPMITFKNGDRYYSCCHNSTFTDGALYSTHKYIDGFTFVKNFEQENYSFRIFYDNFNLDYRNSTATHMMYSSNIHGGGTPDGKATVIGKTYVLDTVASFTIAALEEHFHSEEATRITDRTESSCALMSQPTAFLKYSNKERTCNS